MKKLSLIVSFLFILSLFSYSQSNTAEKPSNVNNLNHEIRIKTDDNNFPSDKSSITKKRDNKYNLQRKPTVPKKKIVIVKKPLYAIPKIEGALNVPLGPLRTGTRVFLKGKNFGKFKGSIEVFGGSWHFFLENLTWESGSKVNGYVPQSANGYPNKNVVVKVKTSANKFSNGWKMKYEGREEKWLTIYHGVTLVKCGFDGNCNYCTYMSFGCGTNEMYKKYGDNYAFYGMHENSWGAVGDDVGDDIYKTDHLKNGWKFKSLHKIEWYKSSGGEVLTLSPPFPVGGTYWEPKVHWKVTPNDKVRYRVKIKVEGPYGTNFR